MSGVQHQCIDVLVRTSGIKPRKSNLWLICPCPGKSLKGALEIRPAQYLPIGLGFACPFFFKTNSLHLDSYNTGQNFLGHLRKLDTKTHFAKLTHILPPKKAWGCCYKGLFPLSRSRPSSVDCVELKLEYITSTLHRGGRGKGRCLNLTAIALVSQEF